MATYYIAGLVTGILATVGGICIMASTIYFIGIRNGHGLMPNHPQQDADVWQVYTPAADDDDDDDDAAGPQAE
jgi:hypothetical protein